MTDEEAPRPRPERRTLCCLVAAVGLLAGSPWLLAVTNSGWVRHTERSYQVQERAGGPSPLDVEVRLHAWYLEDPGWHGRLLPYLHDVEGPPYELVVGFSDPAGGRPPARVTSVRLEHTGFVTTVSPDQAFERLRPDGSWRACTVAPPPGQGFRLVVDYELRPLVDGPTVPGHFEADCTFVESSSLTFGVFFLHKHHGPF